MLPPEKGPGWLITGSVLITTDRLPCATAQSLMRTVWFITTEPVRALITTLATACEGFHVEVFDAARKPTRSSGGPAR